MAQVQAGKDDAGKGKNETDAELSLFPKDLITLAALREGINEGNCNRTGKESSGEVINSILQFYLKTLVNNPQTGQKYIGSGEKEYTILVKTLLLVWNDKEKTRVANNQEQVNLKG